MRFSGQLTWVSTKQGGVSKAGNNWEKVEFTVSENTDRFPNVLLFSALNDKIAQVLALNIGDMVDVDYDAKVRDWTDNKGNARKALELSLFRIQRAGQAAQAPAPAAPAQPINFNQPQGNDGLPF